MPVCWGVLVCQFRLLVHLLDFVCSGLCCLSACLYVCKFACRFVCESCYLLVCLPSCYEKTNKIYKIQNEKYEKCEIVNTSNYENAKKMLKLKTRLFPRGKSLNLDFFPWEKVEFFNCSTNRPFGLPSYFTVYFNLLSFGCVKLPSRPTPITMIRCRLLNVLHSITNLIN